MTIREKGYTHWDGQLRQTRFPWWPITRTGIKLAFKIKGFRLFFVFSLIPEHRLSCRNLCFRTD